MPNDDKIQFIDAVFSDDLVVLLLREKGSQVAQIYTNDEEFKVIDTIRDGRILAIDMVYDLSLIHI